MRRSIFFVCSWLALACGREPEGVASVASVAAEPALAVVEVAPVTAREAAAAVEVPIGVAACDEHVAGYRRCVETLPAADRSAHAAVIEGQRLAWARAKADPALVGELARACAAATTAAKVALPQCRTW